MRSKRSEAVEVQRSGQRPLKIIMWGGLTVGALALAALFFVGGSGSGARSANSSLPSFALSLGANVSEAYEFAIEHPEVLQYIPCYCGCVTHGDTNNEECFIDNRNDDGTIAFDRHGST